MSKAFLREAESLVMELLSIPGVSGQEGAVMEYIARRLREAGASGSAIQCDQAHRRSPKTGEIALCLATAE